MEAYRFYCPDLAAGTVTLPEDQAHHAVHVLRLEAGMAVELFNGRGGVAAAQLLKVDKRGVVATVETPRQDAVPCPVLTLVTAVPKADRAEWLVEQASQLNVTAIQWLDCQRSVVKPREGGGKVDKWRRLAIESAKQCGRNHLLEIRDMRPVEAVVRQALGEGQQLWLLEPRALRSVWEELQAPLAGRGIWALIGPEGGWSPEELAFLQATPGMVLLRLTPTVLRIETACCALAALCGAVG